MKTIRQVVFTTLFTAMLLGSPGSVPSLSAEPSSRSERKLFVIQQGDINKLAIHAAYHEKAYRYTIYMTLTRRRTLEWHIAMLGAFTRDKANPGSSTRNFILGVELAEGWTDDSLFLSRDVKEPFLHTFLIYCDSLEQALARMKLLESKCVEKASAEDTPEA